VVSELAAAAIAFALGWGILRPAVGHCGMAFVAAGAVLAGVGLWVVCAALLLAIGAGFEAVATTVAAVVVVAAVNFRFKYRPTSVEAISFVAGIAVTGTAAAIFAAFDAVAVSGDGIWTVYIAELLQSTGELHNGIRRGYLTKEPLYLPLATAASVAFGKSHFAALQPTVLASGLACFAVLGHRVLSVNGAGRRVAIVLPALAILCLASTPMVVSHAMMLKTHVLVMAHMLIVGAALCMAEAERSSAWFAIAMLFVAPMALMRMEAAAALLPLLVAASACDRVALPLRLLVPGAVGLAWAAWYGYLVFQSSYFGGFDLGWVYLPLVILGAVPAMYATVVLACFAMIRRKGVRGWWFRVPGLLPYAMVAVLLTALAALAFVDAGRAWGVIRSAFGVLFLTPTSGVASLGTALVILLALAPWFSSLPAARPVACALAGYLLILPIALSTQGFGSGDLSPTTAPARTLIQALPAVMFFLMLKFGVPSGQPSSGRQA
jgi:hypothetical protein